MNPHPICFCLITVFAMGGTRPMNGCLHRDEIVSHMATCGEVLAIAIGYQPPIGKGLTIPEHEGGVVVIHRGKPPIRTPLRIGTMRSIIATKSGFVAARVTYDKDAKSTTHFSMIDANGLVTEMPPLEIDLIGLWITPDRVVHAYCSGAIFQWQNANHVWKKLSIDPAVNSESIRRIVTLGNGSSLVVTSRLIKGFKDLQKPPVFVKNLNTYPNPIDAYGDDHWWIVTREGRTQRIALVDINGDIRDVVSAPTRLVKNLMFSQDKVFIVCAWEGGETHKKSYYVLNRDGSGLLRGPFALPDGTIATCLWGDAIVSGDGASHLSVTEIMQ